MASRREFLQMGVAASALPISVGALFSSNALATAELAGPPTVSVPIYKVIFDARFRAGHAFAGHAKDFGAPVAAVEGDITDLWYQDLDLRWTDGPAAIAGLTDASALFCLEHLAWSAANMRVVFRGDHEGVSEASLTHTLVGHPDALREQAAMRDAGPHWTRHIAKLVLRYPEHLNGGMQTMNVAPVASSTDRESIRLVSWVIAPVDRS